MSKIIINSKIKSSDRTEVIKDKKAILKEGSIFFNHNNINHVISIKKDEVQISRNNADFNLVLCFKNTSHVEGKYTLKDIDVIMNIKTVTKSLIIKDNGFKIEYEVYINGEKSDDFIYELDWRCE